MRVAINGVKSRIGVSIIVLAMKYGKTLYILFACSLKNTGLSAWNTRIALNMLPMNKFTAWKKRHPRTYIPE